MKIFKLLQLDSSCSSEQSLALSFGDAYLFRHNRIFRNIRRACIASGYSYNDKPDAAYLALPLSQLENIMNSGQIPYVDNVGVLQQLEKKCPHAVEWFEISENLKRNYVLHESCHAVARKFLKSDETVGGMLALMLEESYANTCELFGILDAEDQAHRIFYESNSYTTLFELRTNLKKACDEIGEPIVFQFFLFGYLHSNYLHNSFSDIDFLAVQKLAEGLAGRQLPAAQIKTVRSLVKVCFTLDLDFRTTTTGLHLKLSQVSPALSSKNSYAGVLAEKSELINSIQRLTQLALERNK